MRIETRERSSNVDHAQNACQANFAKKPQTLTKPSTPAPPSSSAFGLKPRKYGLWKPSTLYLGDFSTALLSYNSAA
jgi:hypothetical protein